MRRAAFLLVTMAIALVMTSGVALAQPHEESGVCVSHEGETINVGDPTSACFSDSTSTAVGLDGSFAAAQNDSVSVGIGSFADASNDSVALGIDGSFAGANVDSVAVAIDGSDFGVAQNDGVAVAIDHSAALAFNACTAMAVSGEYDECGR